MTQFKRSMEDLVCFVYDLEKNNRDQYLGGLAVLRKIAKRNRTLRVVLKSEGLYN